MSRFLCLLTLAASFAPSALAHGEHGAPPQVPIDADWATRHMSEEHHVGNFDAPSFFKLHDFDSDGVWESSEIQRTYGLEHESSKDVPENKRQEVVDKVMELFDTNRDNVITPTEFISGIGRGEKLPDFGLGPGHHGDDEYEYEIHHWEKYHNENTTEDELTHPEDIEHFRKHEEEEEAAERQALLDRQPIVDANIPGMFRRQG